NLDQPLDDPNLRLLPPSPASSGVNTWKRPAETAPMTTPAQSSLSWGSDFDPESAPGQRSPADSAAQSLFAGADPSLWENALRAPLDRLMREGAALNSCSLPPAVRQYAENMLEAATALAHAVDNPGKSQAQSAIGEPRSAFNLQHMVREAHDAVSSTAENAGIGLAWYMPPLLGHMFEGQAQTLRETLCLLLESAVRATTRGAVHLSVRRVPESADPGHLLFTVTDTGAGIPPRSRSTLALTRAWELAGTNNCYLNVECGPQGTSISFTLRLKPLEQETAAPKAREPHITIVADRAVERQDLAHMAAAQGLQSTEARTMREALELNKEAPALLLVVHSPMDGPAETDALDRFKNQALEAGLPFFKALAITADDSRWDALAESGYTHALLEPVERAAFAVTVREVYEEAGFSLSEIDAHSEQPPLEGAPDQTNAEAAATAPAGFPHRAAETQSGTASAPETVPSDLPDLFGASSAWAPHDANSVRLPDLTSLPQILGMTDQMRETALPWPDLSDPATDDAATTDATSAALVADAGVLLSHMAPLPEQPEDPDDPDMPDLSNLESLQLPLPGIPTSTTKGEAAETGEEFSTDPDFDSFAEPEPFAPKEAADAADVSDDADKAEAAVVGDAAHMPGAVDVVDAADFITSAGLEGPQWNEEAFPAPASSVEVAAPEDATPGPEQAMPQVPVQTEYIVPEHTDSPEETATEHAEAVEGEYLVEPFATAAMPAEAQPDDISDAETQAEVNSPVDAQPDDISDVEAQPEESSSAETADAASESSDVPSPDDDASEQLVPADAAADAAPQPVVDEAGPAASLAAAISSPAAQAGQPVIMIQGKIGEAILRPVNAPAAPSAPSATQVHASYPAETAVQEPPQPEVHDVAAADVPQSASPEEYLDRNLAGSDAVLHENLSWGDEWVGEPMPIGTPISTGKRAADTSAPTPAAASQTVKAAPQSPAYVSPSLSSPGEWVGEPMPVSKSPVAAKAEAPAQATPIKEQSAPMQEAPTRSLRAIPWPGPNLSETKGKDAAAAPTATVAQKPVAAPQKSREMPRTATGRLILKLLGNVAASEPAPLPTPETAPQPAAPTAAPTGTSRTAATRLGADSEPSFVDFIAGATQTPAGHISAEQAPAWRDEETRQTQPPEATAPQPTERATPTQPVLPAQEDETLVQLVYRLDAAMEEAQRAYKGRSCHAVGEAASRIANDSDAFGFRVLARMARCVERAAKANDMNALRDLLPELSVAVERNRIALNPRHQGR
ncbi:MAG: hypothetical protein PHI96_00320, partial [Desulfovibrio sp.]|nr:hypothetical protein [Desulfovibrio sp.]